MMVHLHLFRSFKGKGYVYKYQQHIRVCRVHCATVIGVNLTEGFLFVLFVSCVCHCQCITVHGMI